MQSVVSDHGGRISVQSELASGGTTFVIELPENLEALQKIPATQTQQAKATDGFPGETSEEDGCHSKPHLLIVDDEVS